MNHDLIIKTILENNGKIAGSYIGAWLIQGSPSDVGWRDIDIKCSKEQEIIITKKINQIDPSVKLDFRINYIIGATQGMSAYSVNLFEYDGFFKVVYPFFKHTNEWLEDVKNKNCILGNVYGKKDINFEKYLKEKKGWNILTLDRQVFNPNNEYLMKF
jgi:hypothetical protein